MAWTGLCVTEEKRTEKRLEKDRRIEAQDTVRERKKLIK